MQRLVLRSGVLLAVLLASASGSVAAETSSDPPAISSELPVIVVDESTVIDDPVIVDDPAFPGVVPRHPVRLWAGTFFAPQAEFDDNRIDLIRPEIRGRATVPISARASFQVTADFSTNFYDFEGGDPLFDSCAECSEPEELYSAAIGAQGGFRLNDQRHLFLVGEQWALLGAAFVRGRGESGAFFDGVTPGFSTSLGYQLPRRFRLAIGARVERALDGDGVAVGPSVYLRWDVVPKVRFKSRGMGGQLEYRPNEDFDFFVTGLREGDAFRLDDRPGVSGGATFQDRRALVGGGMVMTILGKLRAGVELGAIVDRRISLSTRADGRIDSRDGDPSAYFALRVETRL